MTYAIASIAGYLLGFGTLWFLFYWHEQRPRRKLLRIRRRMLRCDAKLKKLAKKNNDMRYEIGLTLERMP